MWHELLYLLCAALLALETRPLPEREPATPDAWVGAWEARVKRSLGDGEAIQLVTFADGKMLYRHPGNPADEKDPRPVQVEARYTLDQEGRLTGTVISATGATRAREGDSFTFVPKLDEGRLLWEDAKGPGLDGVYIPKNGWDRKR